MCRTLRTVTGASPIVADRRAHSPHDLSLSGGSYPVGFVRSRVWLPVTILRLLKVVRIDRTPTASRLIAGAAAMMSAAAGASPGLGKTDVRYSANTIEEMQKLLLGYRDNMRVEVETGVAITAKTVADLRALSTWPDGLVLSIHVDLDPRLSVVTVERAS